MNKLTTAAILSVILAIGLPLSLAWKSQLALKTAPIIKVKVEAYDPRDLLYGHYLTYRHVWNWKDGTPQAKGDTTHVIYDKDSCLCVDAGDVDPQVQLLPSCPAPGETPACAHIIRGIYQGSGQFDPGINRYYVGETVALPLEGMLRSTLPSWSPEGNEIPGKPLPPEQTFRIGLGLLPNGKSVVEKLYIGDQPLDEYLADHYDELVKPPEEPVTTP